MRKTRSNFTFLCMVILAAFLHLSVCTSTYAQTRVDDSWKDSKITLRVSNESLGHILKLVAEKANATLVLQGVSIIGINDMSQLNVKEMPLDKVIGHLLKDQKIKVRYESGRQIVIEPDEVQPKSDDAEWFQIEGVVMAEDTKETLIGANIAITDGTQANQGAAGCITNIDGKFSLRIKRKSSIRVTYIGYESQSIQITHADRDMKIVLKPGGVNMEEVVVTGISKRKKTSFTGNYITVKGEQLRKMNPNNILKSLQFFDPSFKVLENNSTGANPNAQPEFQMRGDQSLGAISSKPGSMDLMLDNVSSRPNTPLFVLDGFIVPISRVLSLDPERVANITILKDAAATSIYGSKASNGVVVVETKVAPDGALTINYSGNLVIETPDLTDYNMMNAQQKLQTEWEAGVYNHNQAESMNEYYRYLRNILGGVDTYWLSQPLRTAIQHRHSLSAAGGTDLFRYTLDLNAGFTPGVMIGSENNNKSVNFSMSYRKDNISVGATINLTESNQKNSPYGQFSSYTRLNPYYPTKNKNGEYEQILDNYKGSGSNTIVNPLYNANVGIKDEARNLTIASTLNLEYQATKNLRFSEQFSYTRGMARTEQFLPAEHTKFATETDVTLKGEFSKSTGEMTSWSSNFGVNWNLPLDKHLFSLFGNWTISEDKSDYVNLHATGYPDVHMSDFIFGNKMDDRPSGTESISRQMGLIGTFSYSYDNRYSFDFNISGEISSRYAEHKLTPFWSTGVRWNAHEEKWLQGRISNLVLRATYGTTGEQNFSPSDAIEYYTFSGTMKPYTSFPMVGALLAGLNNPNLKWAKTDNLGIGLDVGFWNNRINASFNYYNNITRQLLTNYDLAPSTGFESQVINAGELQNQGFDASLNVIAYQNIQKGMNWTINVNANHNKNKIRKISDYLRKMNEEALKSDKAPLPVYQEGQSTTTYYAVRSLGIDPITGREVFLTRDGKKTFTWDAVDKVPIGDTNPDVSGTISSNFTWNDFSVGLGFSYKWGGIVYNQTLVDKIENSNIAYNLDKRANTSRWHKPGDVVHFKKFDVNGSETPASTRFIMKDNELKLATLNVGYRFNEEKFNYLRRLGINVLSLNFTTNDLFRISPIRMERGLEYPFARSYTLSMSIIFK